MSAVSILICRHVLEVESLGYAVKKEARGESGNGYKSKAMPISNLQADYSALFSGLAEQEVKCL